MTHELSVIILPDIRAMPPQELEILEKWVRDGGLLLRFAGPNMTQGESFLTPVPILKGGRALDGAMTWAEPVKLAPFPENSPLYGLSFPNNNDITVKRQILAEPVAGLEKASWAVLEDGTPLITAKTLGNGLLVLIHTTATPAWSDFALSGLFVQTLRRIVNLSGGKVTAVSPGGTFQPLLILNGFGTQEQPKSFVQPVGAAEFENITPDSLHPPGLYGRAGYLQSLNLGDRLPPLESFSAFPAGVEHRSYGITGEKSLMPHLIAAAFSLFLLDWLIMIALQLGHHRLLLPLRTTTTTTAVLLLILSSVTAQASDKAVLYAGNLYLAYIKTGQPAIDATAQKGLEGLMTVLNQRTSVEPAGVAGLNPATDDLSFFPFIYWPVSFHEQVLSEDALRNIQSYLDHGGTILFDTRDRLSTVNILGSSAGGRNAESLRKMTGDLNIPPLIPMPDDHVLSKSFYLLRSFPGRYDGGTIWIEENSAKGRDGVSSVIIGSHDWATAWINTDEIGREGSEGSGGGGGDGPYFSGRTQQQEMALRFGVNLVMYALTGNYKEDQVHLPHILERLGQ